MDELGTLIGVLLGLLALVIAVAALVLRGKAAEADAEATRQITAMQMNREQMRLLEQQYTQANAAIKTALELAAAVVRVVAPLTPMRGDDAAVKLLEDIRAPGPPEVTTGGDT